MILEKYLPDRSLSLRSSRYESCEEREKQEEFHLVGREVLVKLDLMGK